MKYSFKNDYSEGCHPKILEAFSKHNFSQQPGYGSDDFSEKARMLIREKCNHPEAKVYFVTGGTQANMLVISSVLKSYESVVSADTGHIFTNETGAIEYSGHKVHSVKAKDGKISPENIAEVLKKQTNIPHQVQPKLVYISNSTEVGTVYTKENLQHLYRFCRKNHLYLFVDGARLGNALTSEKNDMTLEDISKNSDIFTIGGTKNGALFGEAIVINDSHILPDFGFYLKQNGALLAKGRSLGLQFMTLFTDNLYFDLARRANQMAKNISDAFSENGFQFLSETATNQVFPILSLKQIEQLENHFDFYVWEEIDPNHFAVRLITSWATTESAVRNLEMEIKRLKKS